MKKTNAKTKTEGYLVKFSFKNKETGFFERGEETVYSFGKDDHKKVEKEVINKYRGKGIKIEIISVIYQ
jgi:hypothetical protein